MNPGHRVCYVASEGKEVAVREYMMLVAYSADPATVSAPATPVVAAAGKIMLLQHLRGFKCTK